MMRSGENIQALDAGGIKGWRQVRIEGQCREHGLPYSVAGLNDIIQRADPADILKNDRTTTVVRHESGGKQYIIKRYNPRNFWHKVKRAFRKSRARRCWEMSFALKAAGLNVSTPTLMLEERIGPIRKDAFFVNECLLGDELLSELPNMGELGHQQVKSAVFHAFEQLAQAKISHGDMKASNLLWVSGALFFIDLDAAQKHNSWSLNWRQKHRKDKRRFLKNWQQYPDLLALFKDL